MSRVMEIHNRIISAAANPDITDEEYFEILDSGLSEMDQIGISQQELQLIGDDIAAVLEQLMGA